MRDPIAELKVKQARLQSTLIQLIQQRAHTGEFVTDGLLRITLTPADYDSILSSIPEDTIPAADLHALFQEHPFGVEVNLTDDTKRAESEVADNVLDLGLANLYAVANEKIPPGDATASTIINRLYQQYQQQRLNLRALRIPEKDKIKRANIIYQHFFNLIATLLHKSAGFKLEELPKLISHWMQDHRSERANRDLVAIHVSEGMVIPHVLFKTAGTNMHIQTFRRWYFRDGTPTVTATAHNHQDEVPNYAATSEASATLDPAGKPVVSVIHTGEQHGSLSPAIHYGVARPLCDEDKHTLALSSYTNMQRLITHHAALGGDSETPHVYVHLLTVSQTIGRVNGQKFQFFDTRVAAYATPQMIYSDYGVNEYRDHQHKHQTGVNSMAMIALYEQFLGKVDAMERDKPPLFASLHDGRSTSVFYESYLRDKDILADRARKYITSISEHAKLVRQHNEHNAIRPTEEQLSTSLANLADQREKIKQAETAVHAKANALADKIKTNVDKEAIKASIKGPLPADSSEAQRSLHYAKQAMFVIQQLRELHTRDKPRSLTKDSTSWINDEANGVIQALIQIVASNIGLYSSSGCKSANDRQYVVTATLSALSKKMSRGEAIATDDLKAMLAELNTLRQSEYGINAGAIKTVLDNGGYPKPRGGEAFERLIPGLERAQACRAAHDKASNTFASHKIKEKRKSILPDDATTALQIAVHNSTSRNTIINFIQPLQDYLTALTTSGHDHAADLESVMHTILVDEFTALAVPLLQNIKNIATNGEPLGHRLHHVLVLLDSASKSSTSTPNVFLTCTQRLLTYCVGDVDTYLQTIMAEPPTDYPAQVECIIKHRLLVDNPVLSVVGAERTSHPPTATHAGLFSHPPSSPARAPRHVEEVDAASTVEFK
ncbi:MAG: hypothetical protein P1U34_00620 [Coxiellaceae bacterium]|nr:hypothetical protein [Coxiellaceae bacterium]